MAERPSGMSSQTKQEGMATPPNEPDHIRDDIERTRSDMGETLDAIQQRLSPASLRQHAMESVRGATVGRAERMAEGASSSARGTRMAIMHTIRQNPIPAAITGIGLGWLTMKSMQGTTKYRATDSGYLSSHSGEGMGSQMTGTVQEKGGQMVHGVQETASQATTQAQQRMQQVSTGAQHQIHAARGQFQNMMQTNPFALGVVAFGLGAAVGFMVPETRKEQELMGQSRDRLMDRAESMAQDTMQRVQHVAEEAQHAAEKEAQAQNLTQ